MFRKLRYKVIILKSTIFCNTIEASKWKAWYWHYMSFFKFFYNEFFFIFCDLQIFLLSLTYWLTVLLKWHGSKMEGCRIIHGHVTGGFAVSVFSHVVYILVCTSCMNVFVYKSRYDLPTYKRYGISRWEAYTRTILAFEITLGHKRNIASTAKGRIIAKSIFMKQNNVRRLRTIYRDRLGLQRDIYINNVS